MRPNQQDGAAAHVGATVECPKLDRSVQAVDRLGTSSSRSALAALRGLMIAATLIRIRSQSSLGPGKAPS